MRRYSCGVFFERLFVLKFDLFAKASFYLMFSNNNNNDNNNYEFVVRKFHTYMFKCALQLKYIKN